MVLIKYIVNNKKCTYFYYSIFQKEIGFVYLVSYNLFYEYVYVIWYFCYVIFREKNLVYFTDYLVTSHDNSLNNY